jgi:hypothetical protein
MIRDAWRISDSPTIAGIRRVLAEHGVQPARADEMAEAHKLSSTLIKASVASLEAMRAVHVRSGVGMFVVRENDALTGVMGFLMLSGAGRSALLDDRLDPLDPLTVHVCARRDEPAAIYGWGIASTNHEATRTLVGAATAMGRQVTPHLRWYLRTATADGERLIMKRDGWIRVDGASGRLLYKPSLLERQAVAA